MSKINKKFKTNYSTSEMKTFINSNVLTNPALTPFLETTNWVNDTLFLTSKLGKGSVILKHNEVEVDIELTLLGGIAKKTLETTLDKEFKQLSN